LYRADHTVFDNAISGQNHNKKAVKKTYISYYLATWSNTKGVLK